MNNLKVLPEFILERCTQTFQADGKGNITICTTSVLDSHWINLALVTLKVEYTMVVVGYDPDPVQQFCEIQWEFRIEDIKDNCPVLYEKWKQMDNANAQYLKGARPYVKNIEETPKIQKS